MKNVYYKSEVKTGTLVLHHGQLAMILGNHPGEIHNPVQDDGGIVSFKIRVVYLGVTDTVEDDIIAKHPGIVNEIDLADDTIIPFSGQVGFEQ
jgi:hypothetical protein